MTEIELRSEMLIREDHQKAVQEANYKLTQANRQLNRVTQFTRSTIEHTMDVLQLGAETSEILNYLMTVRRSLSNADAVK